MKDCLIRGLAYNDEVRFFITRTTNLVEEIRKRHSASPISIIAVGRVATITAMLGAMEKNSATIDVKIKGNGKIGQIIATANQKGEIRATASNMQIQSFEQLNIKEAIGTKGDVFIIKDLGLTEKYTTTFPIVSGEIAEDFSHYFLKSEQIPTAVSLGVLVNENEKVISSGGFVIQVLPSAKEETIAKLEKILSNIKSISKLINEIKTLENIADVLFENNYRILKKTEIKFKCSCSKDKYSSALVSLGKEELEDMAKEEFIETVCSFCNEKYEFSKNEIISLIKNL